MNKIENRRKIEKINETRELVLQKTQQTDTFLARLRKKVVKLNLLKSEIKVETLSPILYT